MATAPTAVTLMELAKQSKKPADLSRLAAAIVGDATDETPAEPERAEVRAGRLGGQARASKMTAEERSESARRAAEARWSSD
jgi:hypothetical protein